MLRQRMFEVGGLSEAGFGLIIEENNSLDVYSAVVFMIHGNDQILVQLILSDAHWLNKTLLVLV